MTRSSRGQAMERVMFYIELKKLVSSVAVGMALAISLALLGCNSSEAPDEKSGDATIPSKRGTPVTQKSTAPDVDRKSTRLNSSHLGISYAVFCLKKKKIIKTN